MEQHCGFFVNRLGAVFLHGRVLHGGGDVSFACHSTRLLPNLSFGGCQHTTTVTRRIVYIVILAQWFSNHSRHWGVKKLMIVFRSHACIGNCQMRSIHLVLRWDCKRSHKWTDCERSQQLLWTFTMFQNIANVRNDRVIMSIQDNYCERSQSSGTLGMFTMIMWMLPDTILANVHSVLDGCERSQQVLWTFAISP